MSILAFSCLFVVCLLTLAVALLILDSVWRRDVEKNLPELNNLSQKDKKQWLCTYYCKTMAEDPIDGSKFDCAILDAINGVEHAGSS